MRVSTTSVCYLAFDRSAALHQGHEMHQQLRQTDVLLLLSRQLLICLFPSVQGFANMQLGNCENILQVSHHISVSELLCLY